MVRNVEISDKLYEQLEKMAKERGVESVEALIQRLLPTSVRSDEASRNTLVDQIHQHREQLAATHDNLEDSVPMIRADRER